MCYKSEKSFAQEFTYPLSNEFFLHLMTSILQQGNVLIVTFFFRHIGETLSTLQFARRAKLIKNKVKYITDIVFVS